MAKDFVLQLRYMGVFPQEGHREYRFHLGSEGAKEREVCLTIDDGLFVTARLMFQEAPDLCYQKLLAEVCDETRVAPILSRAAVTAADIQFYRKSHPTAKARKPPASSHP